jgi:hypothetical protein
MTTTVYEVPLQSIAQQVSITINGVTYIFVVYWNWVNQTWVLDIQDSNGNPLLTGTPLVTGVNLLAQFAYLGFGFALEVQTDFNSTELPTFTNLGVSSHLYLLVTA